MKFHKISRDLFVHTLQNTRHHSDLERRSEGIALRANLLGLLESQALVSYFLPIHSKALMEVIKERLDIASQRSVSPDRTWLKRDIQSIMFAGWDMMDLMYILYLQ